MPKNMTLRLDDAQADALEIVAKVDDMSLTEVVREAIDHWILACKMNPSFQERLSKMAETQEAAMKYLKNT